MTNLKQFLGEDSAPETLEEIAADAAKRSSGYIEPVERWARTILETDGPLVAIMVFTEALAKILYVAPDDIRKAIQPATHNLLDATVEGLRRAEVRGEQ